MNRTRRAATAALSMLLAAWPVFAAMPQPAPAQTFRATGEVVSVDSAQRTFVVRQTGGRGTTEARFHAAPDTRVVVGRQEVALARLVAGQRVRVTYRKAEGRDVATRVAILPAAPPARLTLPRP